MNIMASTYSTKMPVNTQQPPARKYFATTFDLTRPFSFLSALVSLPVRVITCFVSCETANFRVLAGLIACVSFRIRRDELCLLGCSFSMWTEPCSVNSSKASGE